MANKQSNGAQNSHRRLGFEQLEDRRLLAVSFNLLKDINTVNANSFDPKYTVEMGGYAYFVGTTGDLGAELWRSDGTAAGTTLVKDINPGSTGSGITSLYNANGRLFFAANDGVHGNELWTSDGTSAGTHLVLETYAGPQFGSPSTFANLGSTLFFTATDATHGSELWKTDGTAVGTVLVKDVKPGTGSSGISSLASINNRIYFVASSDGVVSQLWSSDGSAAGTVAITSSSNVVSDARNFTNVNGTLYYTTSAGLVRTDGTAAGTLLVKSFAFRPESLFNYDGTLFFGTFDSLNGAKLWKSDGTDAGTVIVASFTSGTKFDVQPMSEIDGILYFAANFSLFRSDGTTAGTYAIWNGASDPPISNPVKIGNSLFFVANQGVLNGAATNFELWQTDGTLAGAHQFVDIYPGYQSSDPQYLTKVGSVLLFGADDGVSGRELWRTDGTIPGTTRIADEYALTDDSSPKDIVQLNGETYFLANGGGLHNQLWKTDGTSAGTARVLDTDIGQIDDLTRFGNQLLFTRSFGSSGEDLWTSDGTALGTKMLATLRPDVQNSIRFPSPSYFTVDGDLVYFLAYSPDGDHTYLWRSDGTAVGTFNLADINDTGSTELWPRSMTPAGNLMYFRADDGVHGFETWRTDGTKAGTFMLGDLKSGSASSSDASTSTTADLPPMSAIGNVAYYFADDGVHGYELWRSDGTLNGTYLLKDINPGATGSLTSIRGTAFHTLAIGNTLYFFASDGVHGSELWKSDGTTVGTVMVADLNPSGSSTPELLTNVNGVLYFSAFTGATGRQLWKLESGDSAPIQVTSIAGGISAATSSSLYNIDGTLYFIASDGTHTAELWRTDGSLIGTHFVYDFTAFAPTSGPIAITAVNGHLVLSVDSTSYGREMWTADLTATGDFNYDGGADADDYSLWRASFGSTTSLTADADRNGMITASDYVLWRNNQYQQQATAKGDFNSNGVIDGTDYIAWRSSFGSTTQSAADGNGNGVVDTSDYVLWRDHLSPGNGGGMAIETGSETFAAATVVMETVASDDSSRASSLNALDLAIQAFASEGPLISTTEASFEKHTSVFSPIERTSLQNIDLDFLNQLVNASLADHRPADAEFTIETISSPDTNFGDDAENGLAALGTDSQLVAAVESRLIRTTFSC